jgi:hypothetical protein
MENLATGLAQKLNETPLSEAQAPDKPVLTKAIIENELAQMERQRETHQANANIAAGACQVLRQLLTTFSMPRNRKRRNAEDNGEGE